MDAIVWITIAIVVGIIIAAIFVGRRGGFARFLFDSNKETAESQPGVKDPGYRRIVSASAAGDYHSETATDKDVMIAQAYASVERAASIAEHFEGMRERRFARRRRTEIDEEPEVIQVRRKPAEPATPAVDRKDDKSEDKKIADLQKQIDALKQKSGKANKAKEKAGAAEGAAK